MFSEDQIQETVLGIQLTCNQLVLGRFVDMPKNGPFLEHCTLAPISQLFTAVGHFGFTAWVLQSRHWNILGGKWANDRIEPYLVIRSVSQSEPRWTEHRVNNSPERILNCVDQDRSSGFLTIGNLAQLTLQRLCTLRSGQAR